MHLYHQQIKEIIAIANQGIKAIPKSELELKLRPDKWSKKEILGHLIDSAYNNHQRFLNAEAQNNLVFLGYNPDEWVRKNRYQERTIEDVFNLWVDTNQHLAQLIEGLSSDLLAQKTTDHNFHKICMNLLTEGAPTNLSYLVWDYIFHIEYHLAQIIPGYEKRDFAFDSSDA